MGELWEIMGKYGISDENVGGLKGRVILLGDKLY